MQQGKGKENNIEEFIGKVYSELGINRRIVPTHVDEAIRRLSAHLIDKGENAVNGFFKYVPHLKRPIYDEGAYEMIAVALDNYVRDGAVNKNALQDIDEIREEIRNGEDADIVADEDGIFIVRTVHVDFVKKHFRDETLLLRLSAEPTFAIAYNTWLPDVDEQSRMLVVVSATGSAPIIIASESSRTIDKRNVADDDMREAMSNILPDSRCVMLMDLFTGNKKPDISYVVETIEDRIGYDGVKKFSDRIAHTIDVNIKKWSAFRIRTRRDVDCIFAYERIKRAAMGKLSLYSLSVMLAHSDSEVVPYFVLKTEEDNKELLRDIVSRGNVQLVVIMNDVSSYIDNVAACLRSIIDTDEITYRTREGFARMEYTIAQRFKQGTYARLLGFSKTLSAYKHLFGDNANIVDYLTGKELDDRSLMGEYLYDPDFEKWIISKLKEGDVKDRVRLVEGLVFATEKDGGSFLTQKVAATHISKIIKESDSIETIKDIVRKHPMVGFYLFGYVNDEVDDAFREAAKIEKLNGADVMTVDDIVFFGDTILDGHYIESAKENSFAFYNHYALESCGLSEDDIMCGDKVADAIKTQLDDYNAVVLAMELSNYYDDAIDDGLMTKVYGDANNRRELVSKYALPYGEQIRLALADVILSHYNEQTPMNLGVLWPSYVKSILFYSKERIIDTCITVICRELGGLMSNRRVWYEKNGKTYKIPVNIKHIRDTTRRAKIYRDDMKEENANMILIIFVLYGELNYRLSPEDEVVYIFSSAEVQADTFNNYLRELLLFLIGTSSVG